MTLARHLYKRLTDPKRLRHLSIKFKYNCTFEDIDKPRRRVKVRSSGRAWRNVGHPNLHLLPLHLGQICLEQVRAFDWLLLSTSNLTREDADGDRSNQRPCGRERFIVVHGYLQNCASAVPFARATRRVELRRRLFVGYPGSARISAAGPFLWYYKLRSFDGPTARPGQFGQRECMTRLRAQIGQRRRARPTDSDVLVRYRPIPRDLKKAIDYIRNHLNGKMSFAELVAHCGVPERTLRKHFRTFIAAAPLKYWRQLRLAGVRACLLEGSGNASITEVAIRFGFSHFGRFAQDYRHHFGETPSATLQRTRIGGHDHRSRPRNNAHKDTGDTSVVPNSSRDRPSIAVLPLQNSATDPDCRTFGEYVAEGIATALCGVRSLSVTVPKASRAVDPRQRASGVGARYLLTGRIAQAGNRLRVIIRLLDAETDGQVWGDTYDGESRICLGWQIAPPKT